MANIIPNEETWIGFVPGGFNEQEFGIVNYDAPTQAEIAEAIDLTDYVVMMNPSTTGNVVPVPRLSTLFEPSIAGTASGQLSAQFYRDDEDDLAWATFIRGTKGSFIISRFGGTGANKSPAVGDACEVWPIQISSEPGDSMTSNTAQTLTITAAVPEEPGEHSIAAA